MQTYKDMLKNRKKRYSVPSVMSSLLTVHPSQIPLQNILELLKPIIITPPSPRARFHNWAQTYHCAPHTVFEPETEHQCKLIVELARREGRKVKAVGVGHSPSDLACTTDFMLRTDKLNRIIEVRHSHTHRA